MLVHIGPTYTYGSLMNSTCVSTHTQSKKLQHFNVQPPLNFMLLGNVSYMTSKGFWLNYTVVAVSS